VVSCLAPFLAAIMNGFFADGQGVKLTRSGNYFHVKIAP